LSDPGKALQVLNHTERAVEPRKVGSARWLLGDAFHRRLPLLLIAWGILLRLGQYLHHRSLWFDEALIALNLLGRSYSGLLRPLDNNQGAPFAFLLIQKFIGERFGFGEYALRLLPLFAGIASLFIFYKVAQMVLPPQQRQQRRLPGTALTVRACNLAVGLAALSPVLIYYSSEAKQYSTDFLVSCCMYWVFLVLATRAYTARLFVVSSIVGAVAIWASHPAVFLLAAFGFTLAILWIARREWSQLFRLCSAALFWAASFSLYYVVSLRRLAQNETLLSYWSDGFIPHGFGLQTWKWLLLHLYGLVGNPIAVGAFLAGCYALYRRNRVALYLLIVPVALPLLASYLRKYPFEGRLLIFLLPSLFLLTAAGTEFLTRQGWLSEKLSVLLIALLFAEPAITSTKYLIRRGGRPKEEIRPVLQYVQERARPGDVCYIYHWAQFQYSYYSRLYRLGCDNAVIGLSHFDDRSAYKSDLNQLRGNSRIWFIFTHDSRDEQQYLIENLDLIGRRIEERKAYRADAYLYDLSATPAGHPTE
jgi:hypothetical protein